MKQYLLVLFTFFLLTLDCNAQDTIVKRNGRELLVKEIIIDKKEIQYKLYNSIKDQIFTISPKDIAFIKYHNGKSDLFCCSEKEIHRDKYRYILVRNDTVFNRYQFGFGMNIGAFNPFRFYKFIENHAAKKNFSTINSMDYINLGVKSFIGLRFNQKFDLNLEVDYSLTLVETYKEGYEGEEFFLCKSSFGLNSNYRIPMKSKLGFLISGSVLFNRIKVATYSSKLYVGNNLGFRLQGGVNFFASRKVTFQVLTGGEYADVVDKNLDMNYSGLVFTINMIFNK